MQPKRSMTVIGGQEETDNSKRQIFCAILFKWCFLDSFLFDWTLDNYPSEPWRKVRTKDDVNCTWNKFFWNGVGQVLTKRKKLRRGEGRTGPKGGATKDGRLFSKPLSIIFGGNEPCQVVYAHCQIFEGGFSLWHHLDHFPSKINIHQ